MADTSYGRSYTQHPSTEEEALNIYQDEQSSKTTATEEAAHEPEARMTPEQFMALVQKFNQSGEQPQDYKELRGRGFVPNQKRGRLFNTVKYMADSRSGALDRNVAGQERQAYSQAQGARTAVAAAGQYGKHLERTAGPTELEASQMEFWRARTEHMDKLTRMGVTASGKPMDLSWTTPWDEDVTDMTDLIEKWEREFNENRIGMDRVKAEIDDRNSNWWQRNKPWGRGGYDDVDVYEGGYERKVLSEEAKQYVENMIVKQAMLMTRLDSAYDELDRRGIQWSRLNFDTGERLQAQDQGGPGAGAQSSPGPGRPAPGQIKQPSGQDQAPPGPSWRGAPEHMEYKGTLGPQENQAYERGAIERGQEVTTRPRAEGAGPGTASKGSSEQSSATRDRSTYRTRIERAAARHGTDPRMVAAIIQQESGFDPNAKGKAGEVGLGQFMATTGGDYGLTGTTGEGSFDRRADPGSSIDATAKHYADLERQFPDNPDLALQAYNAGSRRVKQSLAGGEPLARGTREYAGRVRAHINSALERAANFEFDSATFGSGTFAVNAGPHTAEIGSSEEPWGPAQDRQATSINSQQEGTGPSNARQPGSMNEDWGWTHRGEMSQIEMPSEADWRELDKVSQSTYSILMNWEAMGANVNNKELQLLALQHAERFDRPSQQAARPQQQRQKPAGQTRQGMGVGAR